MTTIVGKWHNDSWFGEVTVDGRVLEAERSLRVRNHSPDGFAWGYGGSGPAQLALAILLEAGLSDDEAMRFYQRFKAKYLAVLPRDSFKLEVDIPKFVEEMSNVT